MRLSASALSEGGNSLDESIGLITAANEVVNDPSSVGTALKTLTLRLRGSKTELEEMGEDVSDMATTTSQLQAKLLALTGGQVDIMLDANTFKNSTQIIREMAEAWEDMTDIQRASALELMGGKRQANTLSALIQNFDTVEKVIETSANSAGSALEENERYLDSIQGKIDQFNNAMQAMWSNLLDSDVVKSFVEWVTKIIKSLDTVEGKLLGLVKVIAIFMAYKKINPFDFIKDVGALVSTIKNTEGGVKQFILSLLGVAPAMKAVTAETIANTLAAQTNDAVKTKQIMSEMVLAGATGTLSAAQKEQAATAILNAMSTGQLTWAQGNAMLAMLGYAGATVAADGSLKTLDATTKSFMASNPIGWILLIVSAVVSLVMWIANMESETEKLGKELSDLKSEISDLKSEIDSLNSELETTQDRMAELLAMEHLSFTEQEELDNLKKQNDELQRELDLLALKEKQKSAETAKKFTETMNSDVNDSGEYYEDASKVTFWSEAGFATVAGEYRPDKISESEAIDIKMDQYQQYAEDIKEIEEQILAAGGEDTEQGKTLSDKRTNIKNKMDEIESFMNDKGDEFAVASEGISYFTGSNLEDWQEQSNAYLDYIDNFRDKWAIISGDENAKSNAINRIFNKEEYDGVSEEIDKLAEKYKTTGDKTILSQISEQANNALKDLNAVGLSVDDVVNYFTSTGSGFDSGSFYGILSQYAKGNEILQQMMSSTNFEQDWGEFFTQDDEGNFKARADKFGKILNGMDEDARKTFVGVVESAMNSADDLNNIDWNKVISSFNISGIIAATKVLEEQFGELNKSVFKGLDDEISGFIDTFSELSSALEDVAGSMDLLHTAQEQMSSSGQISVKTALELIESTDRWNEVLTISNGKITLNAEAEDVLVQSKLNTIKANINEALTSAQLQLQQLGVADTTLISAEATDVTSEAYAVYTDAMNQYQASIAAFGAAIGALMEGDFFGIGKAATSAYDAARTVQKHEQTTSASELKERIANLQAQRDMLETIDTTDEFKKYYDYDELPGDKYGEDADSKAEEALDAFQRAMEYWENRIGANQARYEQLQSEIDLLESKGQKADASYYEEQIKLENERLSLLQQQKAEAQSFLGTFAEGSDEYWEVANTLNDIEGELDDVTASIVDLQDAIAEIDTYKFEEFNTRLDDITSKLETIRDLIAPDGEEDWFDDQGQWTEEGVAVLGSYIQELETYKNGLAETAEELEKYNAAYEGNESYYEGLGIHSEQEYYDKVKELTEQQYDYAQSISDTEQSVVDMYESSIDAVEEYTETLIDSYNDYIDSVKEALDAERDLYEFKKNVQKQSKDIAELERRIASLSGSTNKSEIAERRKLEAELYGAREELNDAYYDHAKDAQSEALDAEATVYEETMNKFIEGLRIGLETATRNMDEFLMGVTSMVMYNADTILSKYEETNLPLTKELTNPWIKAKEAVGTYSGDALDLMNQWTQNGFLTTFPQQVSESLKSPWNDGSTAANAFKASVSTVMQEVVSNISSNVKTASGELSSLYQQILDTEKRAAEANTTVTSGGGGGGGGGYENPPAQKKYHVVAALRMPDADLAVTKSATSESAAKSAAKLAIMDAYQKYQEKRGKSEEQYEKSWLKTYQNKVKYTTSYYAKGTVGTTRDEWAITDEPQFGDELVLIPGKDGNLSFMRKGTGVVPADLTQKLLELAQIPTSDLMSKNMTTIVPNITKNDFKNEFNFESLVHVDKVDSDTLPKLEKMVDKKIDDFSKSLNYSLKKFAR